MNILDENGDPINLTGYTAVMKIRPAVDSDDVICELTTENGKITINALAGQILLSIPASETEGFNYPQEPGVYDLLPTNGAGIVTEELSGSVIFQQTVSR